MVSLPGILSSVNQRDWLTFSPCSYVHGIMDGEAVGRDNKIETLAVI
jgi:hypothetical protein